MLDKVGVAVGHPAQSLAVTSIRYKQPPNDEVVVSYREIKKLIDDWAGESNQNKASNQHGFVSEAFPSEVSQCSKRSLAGDARCPTISRPLKLGRTHQSLILSM